MRIRWVLLGIVAGASLASAGLLLLRRTDAAPPAALVQGTRLFQDVLTFVRTYSVDSLHDDELYRRAASGILTELADPYAVLFLPGQRATSLAEQPTPRGLALDRRDGTIVVVATVPGSPAERAGVLGGDLLVGVASEPVQASQFDQAVRLLTADPGAEVTVRVRQPGAPPRVVTIPGGVTPILPALTAELRPAGVAHVRLRRFVPGLADSLGAALDSFRGRGLRGLALDLRGAVGGELADGVAVADLFLDAGTPLASSRGRDSAGAVRLLDSTAARFADLPIVLLVDGSTAGAAEVVAGALQDHDRVAVLGTTTFGRGVSQQLFELGGGATLRLTTALWVTPSGRQIQRPPAPADGDSVARPSARSDNGRALVGGGGIVPDREIAGGEGDPVLAEAQRLLARAGSPREVLGLLDRR